MTDTHIDCPECGAEIHLEESLAAPLVEATKQKYEQQIKEKDHAIAEREAALREEHDRLKEEKAELNNTVEERLTIERKKIEAEETAKAKDLAKNELQLQNKKIEALEEIAKERDKKLAEAQNAEIELLKQKSNLEAAQQELELTITKRVQESLAEAKNTAKIEAEEQSALKLKEKETIISSMQKQIEELKQKAEQGSQQLQGEAQELILEELLSAKFPMDNIRPVPKGEFGGDVLQEVFSPGGLISGSLLWETKRTKNWSNKWLAKLRQDQRASKAELAIIVSHALPDSIESFGEQDGIWISAPKYAAPLAMVLRQSLIDISGTKQTLIGQETKTELIYQYLTGPKFKLRVEAIVEAFSTMEDDLNKEKKAIQRQWAKREKQIENVMSATVGMYGDLQGIAGQSILQIDSLELDAIEDIGAHE